MFFSFFSLSFKKCNKLDEYIYTYFFVIPIIPSNNFFYNKDRCWSQAILFALRALVIILLIYIYSRHMGMKAILVKKLLVGDIFAQLI